MNRRELLSLLPVLGVSAIGRVMSAASEPVIAANVLLVPDASLTALARDLNARLRADDPRGFALDATHVPHISLLHLFLHAADLGEMKATLADVLLRVPPPADLTATGIETTPWDNQQVVTLAIRRTPQLERMQDAVVTALRAYMAEGPGDEAAFVRDPPDTRIDATTIDYVRGFVPKQTGSSYQPHVTLGLASAEAARAMRAEGFRPRNFRVERVAIYQLGNLGTARRELWHMNT